MLEKLSSNNFVVVPSSNEDELILTNRSKPDEQIHAEKNNLDELIVLLQQAKKQFS